MIYSAHCFLILEFHDFLFKMAPLNTHFYIRTLFVLSRKVRISIVNQIKKIKIKTRHLKENNTTEELYILYVQSQWII